MSKVKVSVMGGKVEVEAKEGFTAAEVLEQAIEELGASLNPVNLSIFINGRQVAIDTAVNDGDELIAAPQVANG